MRNKFSFLKIIGAYCSTDWGERKKVEKKNLQYFGTGETFLFSLAPKRVKTLLFFSSFLLNLTGLYRVFLLL